MLELWYNANMDAESPLYYIYQNKQRIGWIKNVINMNLVKEWKEEI